MAKVARFLCAFCDVSKTFDHVNHSLLFCKLINKGINLSVVRFLHFWYSNQSMIVNWGHCVSQPFGVTNGVRQGGELSPLLFSVNMDELSTRLSEVKAGCFVENIR